MLDMERFEISRDKNNNAWISTNGNGLFKYDVATGELHNFHENSGTKRLIPSNELLCVLVDRSGTIWTGADYTGASQIDISTEHQPMELPSFSPSSHQSNSFRLAKRLPGGDVLLGTRSGELLRYSDDITQLKSSEHYPSIVYDAYEDTGGHLWIATRGSGIYVDGVNYMHNSQVPGSLPNDMVFALCEDKKDVCG